MNLHQPQPHRVEDPTTMSPRLCRTGLDSDDQHHHADADVSPRSFGARTGAIVNESMRNIASASASDVARVFAEGADLLAGLVRDGWLPRQWAVDRLERAGVAYAVPDHAALLAQAFAAIALQSRPSVLSAAVTASPHALISVCASDVGSERIDWLWPGRVALGKLTLIAGKPGLGKSQVTAFIAATVSTGGRWPCDEGRAPRGGVVFFSAEDGIGDTIIPRLVCLGADRSRIEIVSGVVERGSRKTFDLKAHVALLEAKVKQLGDVRLIVIDPISAYMGNVDGNGNVETRGVLEPVAEMAARLRVAVVAVTHLNKGSGGNQTAMERFAGSIAFVAAARAGFIITEDNAAEGQLLFAQVKNNIAPKQKTLAFRLEQRLVEGDIVASHVAWHDGYIERDADDALASSEVKPAGDRTDKAEVVEFLRALLDAGARPVKEVEAQAVEAGFLAEGEPIGQNKAFRCARTELGIKPWREGGVAGSGRWVWELPPATKMPADSQDPDTWGRAS